jgi:hypothetical protein
VKSALAYIGIAGALGMAFCDMVLLAQPVSGSAYDLSSFGAMPNVSAFRASLGSLLGIVCAFFICFGFWHVKQIFETDSKTQATVLFIAFCSVEFFGGAFHAAYYFIAGEHSLRPDVVARFIHHLEILSWLGVPGYLIGTYLFYRLASGKKFPTWFRFSNPLFIQGAFLIVFTLLPSPYGGYLKPTFMNVGFAVFFFNSLLAAES